MRRKKNGWERGAFISASISVIVLSSFASCVPTPSENAIIAPKITDLRTYFIPQQMGSKYLWHFFNASKDSTFFLEYTGTGSSVSFDGFSPISKFIYSDTLRRDSLANEAYISDTLIQWYFGRSDDPLTSKIILLRDTLRVGAKWTGANNFITSNGVPVTIKAEATYFYTETPSVGKIYNNVFLVSYTSAVNGAGVPVEAEFRNGGRIDIYYASGIGKILEIAKDSANVTLWTNELVETRSH